MYEQSRQMASQAYEDWATNVVFTPQWFLMAGLIVAFYAVWLILLDKKRASRLLLIGALAAVAYHIFIMVMEGYFGLFEYKISLTPMEPEIFTTSVTLCPVIIMLAQQYSSTWQGYALWSAAGMAFLNFIVFPVYVHAGILEFHRWNYFRHFLVLYTVALGTRAVFRLIVWVEKRRAV